MSQTPVDAAEDRLHSLLDVAADGLSSEARASLTRSNPVALRAVARWLQIADRLRLESSASTVGTLVILAELDAGWREVLLGDEKMTAAPRRAGVLAAAAGVLSAHAATEGLAALEHRGVVRMLAGYAGPWLAGELELCGKVRHRVLCADTTRPPQRFPATALARRFVDTTLHRVAADQGQSLISIRGSAGSGRDTIADDLLSALSATALTRRPPDLPQGKDDLEPELSGGVAVWDVRGYDPSVADYHNAAQWLSRSCGPAIALLDSEHAPPEFARGPTVVVDINPASSSERAQLWVDVLRSAGMPDEVCEEAGSRLAGLSRAGIGLAARAAAAAELEPNFDAASTTARVYAAVATFARPAQTRGVSVENVGEHTLDDLVLDDEARRGLEELLVLGAMPADDAALRRGAKAMFCGPSGTGKTLAARIVAAVLGRPLYRIDLAAITSKWLGETEKNLAQAMSHAQNAGAVLLFDEGDALMSRRGNVERGSDRYANLEVSFLLQAMEQHDGVLVVTTNVRQHIDVAFTRRFDILIDFRPPRAAERALLWERELGAAAEGLDAVFVRQTLAGAELTGGNIAAAARLARAFAHARGETRVDQGDVSRAVRGELVKIGATAQAGRWS